MEKADRPPPGPGLAGLGSQWRGGRERVVFHAMSGEILLLSKMESNLSLFPPRWRVDPAAGKLDYLGFALDGSRCKMPPRQGCLGPLGGICRLVRVLGRGQWGA